MEDLFHRNQFLSPSVDETLKGPEAVRDFLTTILFRPEEINAEILTALELNGVILGDGMFCVALYSINDLSDSSGPTASQHTGGLSRRQLYMELEAVARQEMAFTCVSYTLRVADVVACIACFPLLRIDDDRTPKLMAGTALSICERFEERYGHYVSAAVSPMRSGLRAISGLFYQALDMLDFNAFMGMEPPKLQSPGDVHRDTKIDRDFSLFSSFATQIRRAIQAKAPEQMQQAHRYAMEYIFGTGLPGRLKLLTRVSNYICIVFQHLIDTGVLSGDDVREMDLLTCVMQQERADTLMAETQRLMMRGYEMAAAVGAEHMDIRVADIKEFIENNISDPALSVQLVARKFQMSQAALSLCFKRSCGQNISDFIHTQRLLCAQAHIRESALPLSEICRLSGYCSTTTMYRAFKKYLNMTPGEFKNSVKR